MPIRGGRGRCRVFSCSNVFRGPFHIDSFIVISQAIDTLFSQLVSKGVPLERVVGISGAAQQHASLYLSRNFHTALACLNDVDIELSSSLSSIFADAFSSMRVPIWRDTSTEQECREIAANFTRMVSSQSNGEQNPFHVLTGSSLTPRFTGPQIRAFYKRYPEQYEKTQRIHLLSSFLSCLFRGEEVGIDYSDASGFCLSSLVGDSYCNVRNEFDGSPIQAMGRTTC